MLTTNDHLTRQMDIIPSETLMMPVHIIGVGAIGSFLALSLAKMGMCNISVWDEDEVSVENMNNQFYRFADIGKNKATALDDLVHSFTGQRLRVAPFNFEQKYAVQLNGIVISAVDSMEVRRMIYESIKETGFAVKYLIDPRMSAEFYLQYTMNPFDDKDQKTYEKTLYTDSEAVQEACTAKSTVYTATLAAGMVVKTIKDLIVKKPTYPRTIQWSIDSSTNPLQVFPGNVQGSPMVSQDARNGYQESPGIMAQTELLLMTNSSLSSRINITSEQSDSTISF